MNENVHLGQYIKNLRNTQSLTLHQVSKSTDVDMTMLSKIERGERLPTQEQTKRIAAFFQVNEDELLTKLTAEKIIKKYGASEITLNALQLVEERIEAYLKSENTELILQDAMEGMQDMPDNSFDLCIADPPYGASSKATWKYDSEKKLNGFGGNWKLTSEVWDLLSQNDLFESTFVWLKEVKRLAKIELSFGNTRRRNRSVFQTVC